VSLSASNVLGCLENCDHLSRNNCLENCIYFADDHCVYNYDGALDLARGI
jgi:hypothetical protein